MWQLNAVSGILWQYLLTRCPIKIWPSYGNSKIWLTYFLAWQRHRWCLPGDLTKKGWCHKNNILQIGIINTACLPVSVIRSQRHPEWCHTAVADVLKYVWLTVPRDHAAFLLSSTDIKMDKTRIATLWNDISNEPPPSTCMMSWTHNLRNLVSPSFIQYMVWIWAWYSLLDLHVHITWFSLYGNAADI